MINNLKAAEWEKLLILFLEFCFMWAEGRKNNIKKKKSFPLCQYIRNYAESEIFNLFLSSSLN